ncbi:MAG: hypothetical protein JXR19_10140 [Bacteroidia bacterium]
MNKILPMLIAFALFTQAKAQDNDTSLLRKLGVNQVEKYMFVHAFDDNDDTCLYQTLKYDEETRLSYSLADMRCFGYPNFVEYTYVYSGDKLLTTTFEDENGLNSFNYISFNDKGDPIEVRTMHMRTNDSSISTHTYFYGDMPQPDSSIMVSIDQMGDTTITKTIPRFNEYGMPVEIITLDHERKIQSEVSYGYRDSTVLLTVSHTTYGDKPFFSQSFYEYDQFDRVVISYNQINQRTEFFYLENGLVSNIFNYNPKGELESEFIFNYSYR